MAMLFHLTVVLNRCNKSQRNELAKWRLITKLLNRRRCIENENSDHGGDGIQTKDFDTAADVNTMREEVSSLSISQLENLLIDMYSDRYSTNCIFSIWRSLQSSYKNFLATKTLFLNMVEKIEFKTISSDDPPFISRITKK